MKYLKILLLSCCCISTLIGFGACQRQTKPIGGAKADASSPDYTIKPRLNGGTDSSSGTGNSGTGNSAISQSSK